MFADHYRYSCPCHIVTCLTQSLRENSYRKPTKVYQVWLLWQPTTRHLVAQAVHHLLYWPVRYEAFRLLALRNAAMVAMGRRLGLALDRRQ